MKYVWTALLRAAGGGYTQTVKVLLAAGADVNARDGSGKSVLWFAENGGHIEIVEVLKEAGAEE